VATILQGKDSNYDTDLLRSLIKGVEEMSGRSYDPGPLGLPFRVIADHARACSFLLADGITPSNEGRGYVLRRILRRAARYGRVLGFNEPFLYRVFPFVQQSLAVAYPELKEKAEFIEHAIRQEEERFNATLSEGLRYARGMIEKAQQQGTDRLSGQDLFLLYDTYGFPLDLAKDMAEEYKLGIDETGFTAAMAEQRARARAARAQAGSDDMFQHLGQLLSNVPVGQFVGYESVEAAGEIGSLVCEGLLVDSIKAGQSGYLTLSNSPFYAESGGQAGDRGLLFSLLGQAEIGDTQKLPNGLIIHQVIVKQGVISLGDAVEARIDSTRRAALSRNHSATHLLHQALRHHLGSEAHQAGSLVTPERLRFDFSSNVALSSAELDAIEAEVNAKILANLIINIQEMSLNDAKAAGALAFFGDKYGDTVRVVRMGDYSLELCGGVHCRTTAEIGSFKIISEGGIGAGLRRIEAVSGEKALEYYTAQEQQLQRLATLLKTVPQNTEHRLKNLLDEHKALQRELETILSSRAKGHLDGILATAKEQCGIKILVSEVEAKDMETLRNMADLLRAKLSAAAIVLAARTENKVNFVAYMSSEAQTAGLQAGNIIKQAAAVCGGGGGGRADMAQAGGKDGSTEKVAAALILARRIITAQLMKK
jgi:alanyl-tRNA synthetase